jgi:glucose/arabinose dehydrogenase
LAVEHHVAPAAGAVFSTEDTEIRIVTIADRLEEPWGFAFLPSGDILITERRGSVRLVRRGRLQDAFVEGAPLVETRDQAGLMDIALHPRFAENHLVYLTYSKKRPNGNTPTLARATFDGTRLTDLRDLFVADAWSSDSGGNTGSRVVFGADGTLYMSVGDRHEQTPAQDLRTHKGKIVRLRDDGSVPDDNPFVGRSDARPEIFAFGVRNPQGLFVDRTTGTIWENEHGPLGGDELNIIAAGHNYGWPAITYGRNYNGTVISNDTARPGMDQPIAYWVPSISPSGLTVYHGDRFPAWRGNVFMGALSGAQVRRLVIEGGTVVHQEAIRVPPLRTRIRDVREGPDGCLYVLTDVPGKFLRIEPAT